MTILEALKHEWKKGDKVWAIIFEEIKVPKFNYDSYMHIPVEVRQITVSNVTNRLVSEDGDVHEIIIDFDGCDETTMAINKSLKVRYCDGYIKLLEQYLDGHATDGAMDIQSKFFDKDAALEKFAQIVAETKQILSARIDDFMSEVENLKNQINEANGKIVSLQETIDKLDI